MEDTTDNLTIRDVARKADVSATTVSRVLNQSSKVAEGTREHVLNVINQLGFVPSSAASELGRSSRNGKGGEESTHCDETGPSHAFTF